MGAAYSIVSERPIDGFDLFVRGEAVAGASDHLERLAAAAGVRTLMDFFSMEKAEVDALFELLSLDPNAAEGEEETQATEPPSPAGDEVPTLDEAPPEIWFEARDGLATVHALIEAISNQPTPEHDPYEPTPEAILDDLKKFAAVLDHLATEGIRWHLAVDF